MALIESQPDAADPGSDPYMTGLGIVLLRESGVWRDRNTPAVRSAQRDAHYAYRLAVEPPAAKELRLFGLASWTMDRFIDRRRQRSGVADAGRAAITNKVEPKPIEVRLQTRAVKVIGYDP